LYWQWLGVHFKCQSHDLAIHQQQQSGHMCDQKCPDFAIYFPIKSPGKICFLLLLHSLFALWSNWGKSSEHWINLYNFCFSAWTCSPHASCHQRRHKERIVTPHTSLTNHRDRRQCDGVGLINLCGQMPNASRLNLARMCARGPACVSMASYFWIHVKDGLWYNRGITHCIFSIHHCWKSMCREETCWCMMYFIQSWVVL